MIMFNKRKTSLLGMFIGLLLILLTACSGSQTSSSQGSVNNGSEEPKGVIKLGLSVPMSGAAASWGIAAEWVAKQAANMINEQGGVEADGKKYEFQVIAYDNKYNATVGAQVGQSLINKDKVNFIVSTIGSAPTLALQALSEPRKVLHFTSSWSKEIKGPKKPYTFTTLNSPVEVTGPLYSYILQQYPDAKSVAIINPNDATGMETAKVASEVWKNKGVNVASEEYYERGTTEFSQIVTKILKDNPAIVDLGASPPGDAGLILKSLKEQGWEGVKIITAGTSGAQLIDAAGDAAEGVFLGLAPDFQSKQSTPVQQDLAKRAKEEINETLNAISMQPFDAIMALKAAIDKTKTLDPDKIKEALPTVTVESSYGPSVFGKEDYYGTPQQLLLPVTVTQIQSGKPVEVSRVQAN